MKKNRVEDNTLINRLVAVPKYLELLRKYNTLETEYESLKQNVKEDLFKEKEKMLEMQINIETLRNENERLREKIKSLKSKL